MGLFGKKKEEKKCCTSLPESETGGALCSSDNSGGCTIKVLGSGCRRCHELYNNVTEAVKNMNLKVDVEYITDMAKVAEYGVMSMPAIVICEKVVSTGSVLSTANVEKLLEKYH